MREASLDKENQENPNHNDYRTQSILGRDLLVQQHNAG
jgi:hypothetical protein